MENFHVEVSKISDTQTYGNISYTYEITDESGNVLQSGVHNDSVSYTREVGILYTLSVTATSEDGTYAPRTMTAQYYELNAVLENDIYATTADGKIYVNWSFGEENLKYTTSDNMYVGISMTYLDGDNNETTLAYVELDNGVIQYDITDYVHDGYTHSFSIVVYGEEYNGITFISSTSTKVNPLTYGDETNVGFNS